MQGWRGILDNIGAGPALAAAGGVIGDALRGALLVLVLAAVVLLLFRTCARAHAAATRRAERLRDVAARARSSRAAPATPKPRTPLRLPSLVSGCWWREAEARPESRFFRRWICVDCGVAAYGAGDAPPQDCKRGLGGPGL